MWPFAHAAIGYVLYSAYTHVQLKRPPNQFTTILVVLGTQFPDLIDKPLTLVGVLTSGRSLGHSYLFAIPLLLVVCSLVYWRTREFSPVVAFGVGYLASPLVDGAPQFLQGTLTTDLREVSFWVWPLTFPAEEMVAGLKTLPLAEYAITHKAAWTAANIPMNPELKLWLRAFEGGITLVAICLWIYDGTPGWGLLRDVSRRLRHEIRV